MWCPAFLERYINNNYGSKRGLLKAFKHNLLFRLGFYKRYSIQSLNFKPRRYVFVCAGNICRSPLAEGVAKKLGVNTASFGLDTRGGDPADPRAIAYAETIGINLKTHVTTRMGEFKPERGDVIIVMEPKHIEMYQALQPDAPIVLLGLIGSKPYIQDPYSCNPLFFEKCEQQVAAFTSKVVNRG
ncbi:low molecular weight phosphatase family protein [Reinekea marinisedimentorum]|uniref:protein-tyrosine-phosphatase n=1 Tax=Reinekea marinisedimentorum TaxID=230495 RepID=A0A4V2UKF1_9GAMM|nr:hypothetical protein [Reinekea marinisedimentorum]TCS44113.1 protein-tyrosine phosphatase [Reinekea marinisedimentorum]